MTPQERTKYTRIAIASALMLAAIFVIGWMVQSETSQASIPRVEQPERPNLPLEAGVFQRMDRPLDFSTSDERKNTKRSLASYYAARAFSGAPPTIPHKILNAQSYGANDCNSCHLDGGWSEEFKAYSPVTPHPEYTNCRQCHVTAEDKSTFRANTFAGARPPAIPKGAIAGAPPAIPHALEHRTNCVACHGGPAAVPELRTTHPERVNCRQCHAMAAPQTVASEVFTRPGYGGGR